jgi:hypothetical protein
MSVQRQLLEKLAQVENVVLSFEKSDIVILFQQLGLFIKEKVSLLSLKV